MDELMMQFFQLFMPNHNLIQPPVKYFSPGCSSESGNFAVYQDNEIPEYAGIAIGDPDDCAIKCAQVKGCAAWMVFLKNEKHE